MFFTFQFINVGMGDDSTVEEYYHLHLDYPEVLRPSCAGVVVSSSKQGVISLKEMASCNRQKPCLIGDADPITTLPFEYKTVGSYMVGIYNMYINVSLAPGKYPMSRMETTTCTFAFVFKAC